MIGEAGPLQIYAAPPNGAKTVGASPYPITAKPARGPAPDRCCPLLWPPFLHPVTPPPPPRRQTSLAVPFLPNLPHHHLLQTKPAASQYSPCPLSSPAVLKSSLPTTHKHGFVPPPQRASPQGHHLPLRCRRHPHPRQTCMFAPWSPSPARWLASSPQLAR